MISPIDEGGSCTSPFANLARRVDTMEGALRDVTAGKGSDLFLFIDEESLRSANPLDVVWSSGKANAAKLTD